LTLQVIPFPPHPLQSATIIISPSSSLHLFSVGCVFAELLTKGEVLLQGEGELAQIHKIFELLGSPTEATWPGFCKLPTATLFRWKSTSCNQASQLLRERFTVNSFSASKKQAFLDENGFDLLSSMLTLNPKKRISAGDALNHSYFTQGVTLKKE
jgi:cell division cycle 2-like protein